MDVYLVRHGIAIDIGENGVKTDYDRTLSLKGRKRVSDIASGLIKLGVDPDLILTSPLPRAYETAEILRHHLQVRKKLHTSEKLEPGSNPDLIIREINEYKGNSIMLVGHMPDLSHLASHLLCGDMSLRIMFKKAGVVYICIQSPIKAGTGFLHWCISPRHMRMVKEMK